MVETPKEMVDKAIRQADEMVQMLVSERAKPNLDLGDRVFLTGGINYFQRASNQLKTLKTDVMRTAEDIPDPIREVMGILSRAFE